MCLGVNHNFYINLSRCEARASGYFWKKINPVHLCYLLQLKIKVVNMGKTMKTDFGLSTLFMQEVLIYYLQQKNWIVLIQQCKLRRTGDDVTMQVFFYYSTQVIKVFVRVLLQLESTLFIYVWWFFLLPASNCFWFLDRRRI